MTSKANPTCNKCGVVLDSENWGISRLKHRDYICKSCMNKRHQVWRKANPEKVKIAITKSSRKEGKRPFDENKECPQFLGVHIAERVLSHVFKNVKRMPMNNPGYDVICNRNKLIDIKSSCQWESGKWGFHINHNTIADFFLCLAFDNREYLNPLYAWLIPGAKVNHLMGIGIRPSTIHKWDAYRLDISKISSCCDAMRTHI